MKVPGSESTLEVLINCKTYPAISSKYIETVCTGGIDRQGRFARLYPIPFRFLENSEQYQRWDVIRVRAYRDTKDTRPESWHLEVNAPIKVCERLKTDESKWAWMKHGVFKSTSEMEQRGLTNGLVEIKPVELYWAPDEKVWTHRQRVVLEQGRLFRGPTGSELADRVPWQFKLRLVEKSTGKQLDQKVLAWSYYQGYRRELQRLRSERAALEAIQQRVHASILAPDRTVYAVFGTHSRFKQWMISALYHVPTAICQQSALF